MACRVVHGRVPILGSVSHVDIGHLTFACLVDVARGGDENQGEAGDDEYLSHANFAPFRVDCDRSHHGSPLSEPHRVGPRYAGQRCEDVEDKLDSSSLREMPRILAQ